MSLGICRSQPFTQVFPIHRETISNWPYSITINYTIKVDPWSSFHKHVLIFSSQKNPIPLPRLAIPLTHQSAIQTSLLNCSPVFSIVSWMFPLAMGSVNQNLLSTMTHRLIYSSNISVSEKESAYSSNSTQDHILATYKFIPQSSIEMNYKAKMLYLHFCYKIKKEKYLPMCWQHTFISHSRSSLE